MSSEDLGLFERGLESEVVTSEAFRFFRFGARTVPNVGAVDGMGGG